MGGSKVRISREKLLAEANATGFRPEVVEKVIHLLNLLEGFQAHPYLKSKLALKGGTALNLFFCEASSGICVIWRDESEGLADRRIR